MRSLTDARLVCIASGLVLAGAAGCRSSAPAEGTVAGVTVPVTVQAARLDTIRATFNGPGTVVPSPGGDWMILAPESGHVAEIRKAEGDAVEPGEVLVRFDIASDSQDVAVRQLEMSDATNRLEEAKTHRDKLASLFERGITSRNDMESARAAVVTAESAVIQAKALLAASTTIAERAVVKARFKGIVAKRWHNEGDFVSAATNDPVLRVIDPTRVQVAVSIPVAEISRVIPGQLATILAATAPAPEPGAVLSLPGPADPVATTGEVRISFSGPTTLPPGTLVVVEIQLDQRTNVVVVPAAAIARADTAYVMIAGADGVAHRRDVRVGLVTKEWAEVITGVTPGDQVIVKGLNDVTDGGAITIEK